MEYSLVMFAFSL